jgi:2-desacetyl-2-hydroxyethyl bacteriochlorophyllide A dehydrogenase
MVQVAFCGICGSDLHLRAEAGLVPAGTVLGHEFSGRIGALGGDDGQWGVGTRVCVFPLSPCGSCTMCREGSEHLCSRAVADGVGLGRRPGAYAEQVLVPSDSLHALPDAVSYEAGALVEPLAVAIHSVACATIDPAGPIVTIGAGPIGAMTAKVLRAQGVQRLVVVEKSERRRKNMERLGFDCVGLDDVARTIISKLGGARPDIVFECAGSAAAPALAVDVVAPRGRVMFVGSAFAPITLSQSPIIRKELEIRGTHGYTRAEFGAAIDMLALGAVSIDDVITEVADLARADEMFDALLDPATSHVKVLLRP